MNRNLNVSLEQAKELYKSGNSELKTILLNSFTKEELEGPVFDRVFDIESACIKVGINYYDLINDICFRSLSDDEKAYRLLKIVTKALNGNWEANYSDDNQKKWYPWFFMSSSGFVFHDTLYRYSNPTAGHASRLALKDKKTAIYAGKQFIDIYKQFIL